MARILMKGNEAIGEAAIIAGCRYYFGYPITPQNELPAYMSMRMPKVGGTFLQAESEVAAINMVFGAAAAGARVMTSSSSPGVSLKMEGGKLLADEGTFRLELTPQQTETLRNYSGKDAILGVRPLWGGRLTLTLPGGVELDTSRGGTPRLKERLGLI